MLTACGLTQHEGAPAKSTTPRYLGGDLGCSISKSAASVEMRILKPMTPSWAVV